MVGDNRCSNCPRTLRPEDFGFLCPECSMREAAIQRARKRTPAETASHLRQIRLHPALHRDEAVANADRRAHARYGTPVLDLSDLPPGSQTSR